MPLALLLAAAAVFPQDAGAEAAAVRATLDAARDAYTEAVAEARDAVKTDLNEELGEAKRKGELGTVEDLLDQRRAFLNDGAMPSSVNTRAYERVLRAELLKLERAYDDAIRDTVRQDRVEDAKVLRGEWEAVQRSPAKAGGATLADVRIVSGAGEPAALECGAKPFLNRGYAWVDVPTDAPPTLFAPVVGGGKEPIVFDVATGGRVYIVVNVGHKGSDGKPVRGQVLASGWNETNFSLVSAEGRVRLKNEFFWKNFPPGRHVLDRLSFSGPIVLLP